VGRVVSGKAAVVQFSSYGGKFQAIDGAAGGMTPADMGVKQSASTPSGHTLQLVGYGNSYAAFTSSGPATGTPGMPNVGQTFR